MKKFCFLFICCFCGQVFASASVESLNKKFLEAYTWKLNDKEGEILIFKDERLNINVGCNSMSTSYNLTNATLETNLLISTMMFCDDQSSTIEKEVSAFFDKAKISISFVSKDLAKPILKLSKENGKSYKIYGDMTPEAKYGSKGETIFLEIAAEKKPCTGVVPQECLQVRYMENHDGILKPKTDWEYFYSPIEGYEHSDNYEVILRVKRYKLKNVPADHGAYVYVRDMVVSQKSVEK